MHDVVRQVGGEAAGAEHAGQRIHVRQHGRRRAGARLDDLARPGVAEQRLPRREDAPRTDCCQSAPASGGSISLDDEVDHAVEQLVLVGHVLVERHRDDAELLREPAHVDRVDPGRVGEVDGGAQHAVPVQGVRRVVSASCGPSGSVPSLSTAPASLTGVHRTPTVPRKVYGVHLERRRGRQDELDREDRGGSPGALPGDRGRRDSRAGALPARCSARRTYVARARAPTPGCCSARSGVVARRGRHRHRRRAVPGLERQSAGLALGYASGACSRPPSSPSASSAVLTLVTAAPGTPRARTTARRRVGQALVAVHDWTFLLGPNVALGVNTLLLAYLVYRSGLVPRFIAVLGLVGGPLIFASAIAVLFGALRAALRGGGGRRAARCSPGR